MSDFKKGILVGMLIIIGCGTFMANSSNDDIGRFQFSHFKVGSVDQPVLLDTKTGDTYGMNDNVSTDEWIKWKVIKK